RQRDGTLQGFGVGLLPADGGQVEDGLGADHGRSLQIGGKLPSPHNAAVPTFIAVSATSPPPPSNSAAAPEPAAGSGPATTPTMRRPRTGPRHARPGAAARRRTAAGT